MKKLLVILCLSLSISLLANNSFAQDNRYGVVSERDSTKRLDSKKFNKYKPVTDTNTYKMMRSDRNEKYKKEKKYRKTVSDLDIHNKSIRKKKASKIAADNLKYYTETVTDGYRNLAKKQRQTGKISPVSRYKYSSGKGGYSSSKPKYSSKRSRYSNKKY